MRRRRNDIVLFFLASAPIALASSSALADEPPAPDAPAAQRSPPSTHLGAPGHVALDDVIGLHVGSVPSGVPLGGAGVGGFGVDSLFGVTSIEDPDANAHTLWAWVAPSLDVFVGTHFTLGARALASYQRFASDNDASYGGSPNPSSRGYAFGVVPRVGYLAPLGSSVWLWPKIGAGYDVSRAEQDDGGASYLARTFVAQAEAGLVLALGPWAYVDLAPVATWTSTTGRGELGGPAAERGVSLVALAKLGIAL